MGPLGSHVGSSWRSWQAKLDHRAAFWVLLGAIFKTRCKMHIKMYLPNTMIHVLGSHVGLFWWLLEGMLGHRGGHVEPSWSLVVAMLGAQTMMIPVRTGCRFGFFFAREPSWGLLEAMLGHLGGPGRPCWTILQLLGCNIQKTL